jgi:hypothetical protein
MRRAIVLLVLMVAATGAGIAAASTLVIGEPSFEQAPEHLLPGPAELMVGARAPGPRGAPEWAVRTYVSRTGLLCAERGRLVAGVFGDLAEDGGLEPRPAGPTGICGDTDREPVVAAVERIAARGAAPARTIVFGASSGRPADATVRPARGAPPVDLPIGPRGSFIAVFDGLRDPPSLPLEVTLADGRTQRFSWTAGREQR